MGWNDRFRDPTPWLAAISFCGASLLAILWANWTVLVLAAVGIGVGYWRVLTKWLQNVLRLMLKNWIVPVTCVLACVVFFSFGQVASVWNNIKEGCEAPKAIAPMVLPANYFAKVTINEPKKQWEIRETVRWQYSDVDPADVLDKIEFFYQSEYSEFAQKTGGENSESPVIDKWKDILEKIVVANGWRYSDEGTNTKICERKRTEPLLAEKWSLRTLNLIRLPDSLDERQMIRIRFIQPSAVDMVVPYGTIGRTNPKSQEYWANSSQGLTLAPSSSEFPPDDQGYFVGVEVFHPLLRVRFVSWMRQIGDNSAVRWAFGAFFGLVGGIFSEQFRETLKQYIVPAWKRAFAKKRKRKLPRHAQ